MSLLTGTVINRVSILFSALALNRTSARVPVGFLNNAVVLLVRAIILQTIRNPWAQIQLIIRRVNHRTNLNLTHPFCNLQICALTGIALQIATCLLLKLRLIAGFPF
jgi:hypothetical protein